MGTVNEPVIQEPQFSSTAANSCAAPRIVCVVGMHRSGTSLTTRILNLLGVSLGPDEHLMPPVAANPSGFWEHQLLSDLNEEILLRLGGHWHDPPAMFPGWESDPRFADLRQRARDLTEKDFAGSKLWGWKDPRNCLTLPFWQQLLAPLQYVICLRNPLDVVQSLKHRDGFPLEKAVGLWLTYVKSALSHTAGRPRLLICYEDIMEDWAGQLHRLAKFIGMTERAECAELQDAVRNFVDMELCHHRTSLVNTADEPTLPFPVKALYVALHLFMSLQQQDCELQGDGGRRLGNVLDIVGVYASEAESSLAELRSQAAQREVQAAERGAPLPACKRSFPSGIAA